jgi:hypothetical protein
VIIRPLGSTVIRVAGATLHTLVIVRFSGT